MPPKNECHKSMAVRDQNLLKQPVKFCPEKCPIEYRGALSSPNIKTWGSDPGPCDYTSPDSPNHAKNYNKLLKSLRKRMIMGPKPLEYIFSRGSYQGRALDQHADACMRDLKDIGADTGLLEHFGALVGEGTVQSAESSRAQESGSTKNASAEAQNNEQAIDHWVRLNAGQGRDEDGKRGSWGKVSISTMTQRSFTNRCLSGSVTD